MSSITIGKLELTVRENKSVDVPLWAGFGAVLAGGLLLVISGRKPASV